jgi:hypothetical protein
MGDNLEMMGDEQHAPILQGRQESSDDFAFISRRRPLHAKERQRKSG